MASSPSAKHDPTAVAGTLEARIKREGNPVVRFFLMLGPGLVTGASDDDPSGIGTYATAGAFMGYAMLWLAWVTFPLMASVQYICAKVGLVSRRGLAGMLRDTIRCEALGWKHGLDQKVRKAKKFYALIIGSTVVGALINYLGVNPMTALFWTAVLNGFLAPPLLVVIMLVSNNRAVMGKRVNGWTVSVLGWATTIAIFAAAVALVVTWGQG